MNGYNTTSDTKTSANSPTIQHIADFQYVYDINNDGMKDFVIFKTEFSTDTAIYIDASYSYGWNFTKSGAIGGGGIPIFYVVPGTYNISFFLGLNAIKNVNNPNTLVDGNYALNITAVDASNINSKTFFSFPIVFFEFNTSQISNNVSGAYLFSPVDQMFVNKEIGSYYIWNYTQTTIQTQSIVKSIGSDSFNPPVNGTLELKINSTVDGFPIGKVFNNNISYTSINVPVEYPFSFLKLPRELNMSDFQLIMKDHFAISRGAYILSYFNTSDTLGVNLTAPGFDNFTYNYNFTNGALLYYHYHSENAYFNGSESLTLIDYSLPTFQVTTTNSTSSTATTTTNSSSTSTTTITTSGSNNSNINTGQKTTATSLDPMYILSGIFMAALVVRKKKNS